MIWYLYMTNLYNIATPKSKKRRFENIMIISAALPRTKEKQMKFNKCQELWR